MLSLSLHISFPTDFSFLLPRTKWKRQSSLGLDFLQEAMRLGEVSPHQLFPPFYPYTCPTQRPLSVQPLPEIYDRLCFDHPTTGLPTTDFTTDFRSPSSTNFQSIIRRPRPLLPDVRKAGLVSPPTVLTLMPPPSDLSVGSSMQLKQLY